MRSPKEFEYIDIFENNFKIFTLFPKYQGFVFF